ncbi:radical SAM/SPASM domain-containing protein [Dysgonomonas sp. ZJ709]|uniref:radical SAM/SPASM domain-containing protein n=1 Tax=Dysgonomonas sp. ZJ709 TaxID=2709797 RepID=UPI0013EAF330|nr:radical SAM protein [Dysgonomonas sp. ZJ709]
MKISKYTILFDIDRTEFYIYSTLSNALIEIDEDSFQFLLNAKKNKLNIFSSEIDSELHDILILKKFIVENDLDGFLYYKSILTTQRANQSSMHLTIAPTMNCCFNCHYCFEKYKDEDYMSESVMDTIIDYLNLLPSKPELKLTWFGGEPLMALTQMEQFYNKLESNYKKPVLSDIITTGYHIDENTIRVMQNIEVKQVQITLDGLKNTHNKIKYTSDCEDVFNKVLNNVELLLNTSNIHVVFRINLTKNNSHEYIELYNYLINRFKHFKNKGIAPGFVMARGECETLNEDHTLLFAPNEVSDFVLGLYHKYQVHTPFLRYPSRFFIECAIKNVMSISFDPQGYAYKCWEIIGNKKYAIGRLDKRGRLENVNQTTLNRHLYGADPLEDPSCSACKYLPVCNGGCPIQRIENVFEGKKNNCCTFYKGKIEDFLKIHIKLKEQGIENRED